MQGSWLRDEHEMSELFLQVLVQKTQETLIETHIEIVKAYDTRCIWCIAAVRSSFFTACTEDARGDSTCRRSSTASKGSGCKELHWQSHLTSSSGCPRASRSRGSLEYRESKVMVFEDFEASLHHVCMLAR